MSTDAAVPALVNRKPRLFYGYVIVIAAFFIMFIMSGTLYSYGIFLKPLSEEFGWTRAVTSGAYSMAELLIGILFMVTGRMTDRFGPRKVVTLCGFVLGLGYLLMSRVGSVWQLYLTYGVIIAAGQSGGLIPTTSTVARWFAKRRGLMTGLMVAGIGLGQVVFAPVATQLMTDYGWRKAYLIMGFAVWAMVITAAQFLKRDPGQIGQSPDGGTVVSTGRPATQLTGYTRQEALHTRKFWFLLVAYFCYGFTVKAILIHIVPHVTDLQISAITAASILAIIGGVSVAGRIGMGTLGDRIGNRKGLVIVFSVALAALLWLQGAGELWALYLFATVFGFAYGGLVVLESPTTAELFGLKSHGAILGLIHFGANIGGAISPLLTGRLFDVMGSYQVAFRILAAMSIVGLVVAVSLLKPGVKKRAVGV